MLGGGQKNEKEITKLVENAEWRDIVPIAGTDEFVLVAGGVARRHRPGAERVVWRRQELPHGEGKVTTPPSPK